MPYTAILSEILVIGLLIDVVFIRKRLLPGTASFENLGQGRVYYAFDRTKHVAECRYRPGVPLIWSLDFNVHPMCSVLAQRVGDTVYVLDELVLPDSNTPAACDEFLRRTEPWWSDAEQVLAVHVHELGSKCPGAEWLVRALCAFKR